MTPFSMSRVFRGGRAFVVDIIGAAEGGDRRIVVDRDEVEPIFLPNLSQKTDVFFRMKSASRRWPTASWMRTPAWPGERTTGISPAGAGLASRRLDGLAGRFLADLLGRHARMRNIRDRPGRRRPRIRIPAGRLFRRWRRRSA